MTLRAILRSLSRREKFGYFGFLSARVFTNFLDVAGLSLLALAASSLSNSPDATFHVPLTSIEIDFGEQEQLIFFFLALMGLFIVKSILGAIVLRAATLYLSYIDARQSRRIAAYLFQGQLAPVARMSKGEITWSVTRSTETAFSVVLFSLSNLVTELTLLLAISATLFVFDPLLTLSLLGYLLTVAVSFYLLLSERIKRLGERTEENATRAHEIVDAILGTLRETATSGTLKGFLDWLFVFRTQQARDYSTQRFIMALPRYVVEAALLGGLVLLVIGHVGSFGLNSLASLSVFLFGGLRLTAALLPVQNALTELRVSIPQSRYAVELLENASHAGRERVAATSTNEGQSWRPSRLAESSTGKSRGLLVEVENLTFFYHSADEPALNDVSLTIPGGEIHALVGPSGSGKSTLADCIIGSQTPDAGRVNIAGHGSPAFIQAFPGLVSYVPQSTSLVPGTVLQNITLRRENSVDAEEAVEAVLGKVGLLGFINSLPQGVRSLVGSQLDSLSGGQLQRLAIARALYTRPKLIVLDEPTSSLDAISEAEVNDTILSLKGSTTVVVIAHRVTSMKTVDRIHFLKTGRLLGSGSFTELRTRVGDFDSFVRLLSADN